MAHTVIQPPRGTTVNLELTHKGNINDKTIPERDREVRDFNVTLLASAITRVCCFAGPTQDRFGKLTFEVRVNLKK